MTLTFAPRSDLYQAGLTEDGEAYIAEVFYVVAQAPDGSRWAHDELFRGCAVHHDDEGYEVFGDVRDLALHRCERLTARTEAHVAAGGRLDPAHWNEIDPAYGSAAYQGLDRQGYFLAAERQRDRDRGEHVPFDIALDGGLA